jgi:drug/metabolite transporter (DMT)-like permease
MNMQQWQSWALSIVGVIGIYLTGRKNWRGYAVGIFTECAWVWYSIVTKQWGFIFGSTIYISVYLLNINKWLSEAKSIKNRFKIHIFRK